MSDNQKKASLFCVLAFLLGCLLASSGCAVKTQAKSSLKHIETSLEIECCPCCGFAPWSDSWCERHYGT